MMRRMISTRIVMSTFLLLGLAFPASAAASKSAKARWGSGTDASTASLIVEFDGPAPAIEAAMVGSALEVSLDGATVADAGLPEGVTARRDGATTRLRIERPGLSLRSVRVDGGAATIVVSAMPKDTSGAPPSYAIGVGDVLTIAVYKNADLSGEFTVAPDGSIAIPLVGSLPVNGRTEAEVTSELTRKLADKYLVDPQVSVSVKSYLSQFIYVTGSVARSGRVPIRPGLTLRGALAEVEAAISPNTTVELRRATGEVTTIDVAALDAADAPLPRAGDVLTVQQSNYVSIYGEVRRPNRLMLTPGMTLLQAIAMAEGLTDWASKKKVQILRKGTGGPTEVSVNLNAVESHEVPDPLLQPEDVIIVGRRVL